MVDRYFTRMLSTFGVLAPSTGGGGAAQAGNTASTEDVANALSSFRDELRSAAIANKKAGGDANLDDEVLRVCDALRDEVLPALGIQLDDRPSGVAQVKIADPKLLMAEAARKAEAAKAAAEAKAAKAAKKEAEAAATAARAAVPPAELFDPKHDELFEREVSYGALDDDGLPTEDAAGEPLSKSARKKLAKVLAKHAKMHAAAHP